MYFKDLIIKTSYFNYYLPHELIAQTSLKNREKSRMMLLDKESGEIKDEIFENIGKYLNKGDTLVLNDTKVMPARLYGHRKDKNEMIEVLLLKQTEGNKWQCLVKPGKKMKIGTEFIFEGIFNEILDELGTMPLPPYITEKLEDKSMYQTVYCKHLGSAAAPTAGLHFTKQILKDLENFGINIVYVTLHVGIGTFRPVKVEDVTDHKMHSEYFVIDEDACKKINDTKKRGNRVIAVGTTSCRVLESATDENGVIYCIAKETDIFIYPGYKFKMLDALITNFHLPESTLIMLVSALAKKDNIMSAYNHAVEEKYRFFSFGDCMFIY